MQTSKSLIFALALVSALLAVGTRADITTVHEFSSVPSEPDLFQNAAAVVQAGDGKFYGICRNGGIGWGIIYRMTTAGVSTEMHAFTGTDGGDGGRPIRLVLGEDGLLYGMTSKIPTVSTATLFRMDLNGNFTTLHHFTEDEDSGSSLVALADGTVYGLSKHTFFKCSPNGTYTALGSTPTATGKLIHAGDGNFYVNTGGAVIKITQSDVRSTLFTFDISGKQFYRNMVLGRDGNLYGLGHQRRDPGPGTTYPGYYNWLWKLTLAGNYSKGSDVFSGAFPILVSVGGFVSERVFCEGPDGFYVADNGELIRFNADGSLSTVGHYEYDGPTPPPSLAVFGSDGAFYGLSSLSRQRANESLAFTRTTTTGVTTDLSHDFGGGGGNRPAGGLVVGKDGKLYGTTSEGGAQGRGTLFRFDPATGSYQIVHTFTESEGWGPTGRLVVDSNGNFYGTTHQRGSNNVAGVGGTIFTVSLNGACTTLHRFGFLTEPTSGFYGEATSSVGRLTLGSDGALYGTTEGWTAYPNGKQIIYRLTTEGQFTTLGTLPPYWYMTTELTVGSDGKLYGCANDANGIGGGLYQIDPSTGKITRRYRDRQINGVGRVAANGGDLFFVSPYVFGKFTASGVFSPLISSFSYLNKPGGLIRENSSGLFYGSTTSAEGDRVFVASEDGGLRFLHQLPINNRSLEGQNGTNFVQAPDGKLYSVSIGGGSRGGGFIYRVDPLSSPISNQAPVAQSKEILVRNSLSIDIAPLTGATDADGDPIFISHLTAPTQGAVTLGMDRRTLSYKPGRTFSGKDSIVCTVSDGFGGNTDVTVTVRNPFLAPAGIFIGLIQADDASGKPVGSVTLKLTTTGRVTGKLVLAGVSHTLLGDFDYTGAFHGRTRPAVNLDLHMDVSDPRTSLGISGSVGGQQLTADRAAYRARDVVTEKGKYTALMLPDAANTTLPQGTGYAVLTVSKSGNASMVGRLADATPFSIAGPLVDGDGANELIVFNRKLYKARGLLSGAIEFVSQTGSNASGTLHWSRPAIRGSYHPAGFDATLTTAAAIYTKPPKGQAALPFTDGTCTLSAGGLSEAIAKGVTLTTRNTVTVNAPNTEKVKMQINAISGRFTGSFLHPVSKTTMNFGGVLYQNTDAPSAGGFFLGPVLNGSRVSGDVGVKP